MWLVASFGFDVCVNVVHSFDKYNVKWHSIRSSWILIYFILECFVFCLTAAAKNIARPNDSSSHRKLVWKAQLSKYKQFSWNLNIIIILFYSGDNGVWNAIELNRENTRNENIYSLLYANVKLFHKINTSPPFIVRFYQKLFSWIGKQTDFRGILSCHLDATFKK